jgi:uncharacterized protein (DUF433 family)
MSLSITTEACPVRTDADGVVRVGNSRVTLDTVVAAFEEGATAEEIAQQYPSIPLADVCAVLGYYLRQRDAVICYLRSREKSAKEVRAANESRFDPAEVRARLMARSRFED